MTFEARRLHQRKPQARGESQRIVDTLFAIGRTQTFSRIGTAFRTILDKSAGPKYLLLNGYPD